MFNCYAIIHFDLIVFKPQASLYCKMIESGNLGILYKIYSLGTYKHFLNINNHTFYSNHLHLIIFEKVSQSYLVDHLIKNRIYKDLIMSVTPRLHHRFIKYKSLLHTFLLLCIILNINNGEGKLCKERCQVQVCKKKK